MSPHIQAERDEALARVKALESQAIDARAVISNAGCPSLGDWHGLPPEWKSAPSAPELEDSDD